MTSLPPRGPDPRPSGSSDEAVLAALSTHLGVPLAPRTFTVRGDVRVGVDGADAASDAPPRFLVTVNGGSGQLKSLQRNRVIADAFKLDWLRGVLAPGARAVLAVSEPYGRLFVAGAWLPVAVRERGIEVAVVSATGGVRFLHG
ncbi:hypothetical protein [Actinotalea sp.]|uniref:hypothetical protein n=1 Tax=Actinotalea sp. TaxID=1872145 RepID=UPI0035618D1A